MNDITNEVIQRKERIRDILLKLHRGEDLESVQADFSAMAEGITSQDIAEAEQLLINEGVPVSDIQSLCDLHVAAVRASLEKQKPADPTDPHPIQRYQQTNQAIAGLLTEAQALLQSAAANDSQADGEAFWSKVQELKLVDKHYKHKENILFPYLERVGFMGPSQVMWGVHTDIRRQYKALLAHQAGQVPADIAPLSEALDTFAQSVHSMIYKEEKILFPAALEKLSPHDWDEIKSQ